MEFKEIHNDLKKWASDRGLLDKDPHMQFTKIVEELGETSAAFNKQKHDDLIDSIGDLYVTISIFCHQVGLDPEECFTEAWNTIAHRKGKTIDGIFVKESDLKHD